jgi:hypothetical protein
MDAMTQCPQFAAPDVLHDIVALAQRYCDLIDRSGRAQRHWLREVAMLLPQLQMVIVSLNVSRRGSDQSGMMDLDTRFELFSHLRRLLADRDSYWLEFDSTSDGVDAMTGSLADDLTDIYCELKHGLLLYALNPDAAFAVWSIGYDLHWGPHLIDAERHLAMLEEQSRLDD